MFYFVIPFPNVSVTVVKQNLVLLRCDVSIVSSITSNVVIVWKVNDTEVEQYKGSITVTEDSTFYESYYNTSKTNDMLTVNDIYTVYQCQATIETSPPINNTSNVTLNVGKYNLIVT